MHIRLIWLLVGAVTGGCGGARSEPASAEGDPAHRESPASLTVYDAKGQGKECSPPSRQCPAGKLQPDFTDKCRLRGYQTLRCGCETLCTGNVMTKELFYDAEGNAKECVPADEGCVPEETSAAFQDACAEAHHRLVVCGCEWLCDGPTSH